MIYLTMRFWLFLLSALVLAIIPLPDILTQARPLFYLLFVFYIQFYLPNYFNLFFIFVLGLCLDVLLSTVMGEHTFALLLTTWLSSKKIRRFHFFSSIQQLFQIGLLCLIYELSILSINAFLGFHYQLSMSLIVIIASTLIWPWFKLLLDRSFKTKEHPGVATMHSY